MDPVRMAACGTALTLEPVADSSDMSAGPSYCSTDANFQARPYREQGYRRSRRRATGRGVLHQGSRSICSPLAARRGVGRPGADG